MDEITGLVQALKSLTKGEEPNAVTLLVAEDGWNTRPDTDSYGIVYPIEFEADQLNGDDRPWRTREALTCTAGRRTGTDGSR